MLSKLLLQAGWTTRRGSACGGCEGGRYSSQMLASQRDRETTLHRLRAAHLDGVLSLDTFEWRVERTFRADRDTELGGLVTDLPTRWSARLARVRRPWRGAVAGALDVRLPGDLDGPATLGRSRSCQIRVAADTVSAQHAELRPLPGGRRWLLIDLGSTNGTWFLGRRVGRAFVEPGDAVVFGDVPVLLLSP